MKKSGKIIILISIVIALIAIVFRTFIGNCFIFAKIYIKVQSTSINFDNLFFEETIEVKSTGNSSSKYYFKDGIKGYQIFEDLTLGGINQSLKDKHSSVRILHSESSWRKVDGVSWAWGRRVGASVLQEVRVLEAGYTTM